jgi:hypothetical protein
LGLNDFFGIFYYYRYFLNAEQAWSKKSRHVILWHSRFKSHQSHYLVEDVLGKDLLIAPGLML